MKVKKRKTISRYHRDLIRIVDAYLLAHPDCVDIDWDLVIAWGEVKGLISKPLIDPHKKLKNDFARAAREDVIYDENGDPVRRLHAYKVQYGEVQKTLWGRIEDMTPEKWRVSMSLRRRGYRSGVLQCDRDNQHFNKNYNPGDPVEIDWNFNPDVQESRMPTEYPEEPPAGDED